MAVENSEFDFQIIATEVKPFAGNIHFTNEEIYNYLVSFKNFMENEEYGLLTDGRPNNLTWRRENILFTILLTTQTPNNA